MGDPGLGSNATVPGTFEGSSINGITYTSAGLPVDVERSLPIPQQFAPLRPSPLDGSRADSMVAICATTA